MYSSCASSTCMRASRLRARVAKMSRITSARSMTRQPVMSSMFFPCVGDSSSSKMTSVMRSAPIRSRSSSIFPLPR